MATESASGMELPTVPVTPASAGWKYLSFDLIELQAGQTHEHMLADQETAVTPLSGAGTLTLGEEQHKVGRTSVFEQLAPIGYAAPGTPVTVTAETDFTFAIGSAPAEGMYPSRLIAPSTIKTEVRGGGAAHRQVNHSLAYPIEAERLILYEVYVPRGTWSGWPPHRHDGVDDSPYLEEVYYFRLDRPEGFWMHRNWHDDNPDGTWEQIYTGYDKDFALVPAGYHSSVACPGSNMYFLNYLAGDLVGEARKTPPCFAGEHTWIESCLLYTSPSPRDATLSRMPSSA